MKHQTLEITAYHANINEKNHSEVFPAYPSITNKVHKPFYGCCLIVQFTVDSYSGLPIFINCGCPL